MISLFPLGLFRIREKISPPFKRVIYPEPRGVSLKHAHRFSPSHHGNESDFKGLVETDFYCGTARLHWPSVAKGAPMAKEFEKESPESKLYFDYDKLTGDKEYRISQLTLWALEAERSNTPFSLKLPTHIYESEKEGIDGILKALALI